MNREEHLQWAKDRALEYWRQGDLQNAWVSMMSDLNKHRETKNFSPYILTLGIIFTANQDHDGMKRWIDGFR